MKGHSPIPPFRFLRLLRVSAWFLSTILIIMGVCGKRGVLDLQRMKRENDRLEEELKTAKAQHEDLTFQIQALQRDPQAQEFMIRKVLGYIRTDETVIEF